MTAYGMRISDWSSDVCSSYLPGVRNRRAKPHGRRSRPRGTLGHGPSALAAPPPGSVGDRTGEGDRPEPQLRAGSLHAGVRPLAGRRPAGRDRVLRPFATPTSARTTPIRPARRTPDCPSAPQAVSPKRPLLGNAFV